MTVTGNLTVVTDELEAAMPPESRPLSVSPKLVVLADPASPSAESIRQLRTRIIAQHVERGRRVLVLCSPTTLSGCSFVAANLAVAFAQTDMRVLLMNADLRHCGFDELFGELGSQPGLLQFLSSPQVLASNVTYEILANLSIMPSGGAISSAQELLSTSRFESLVNSVAREYDLTIIDTPPANLFADAQRVAAVAGYSAIVARSHQTYFNDVTALAKQLHSDGVRVVGTVLNQH